MQNNIKLKYDGHVNISRGRSRMETSWNNWVSSLSELYKRFSRTTYTAETVEEYKKLPKKEQDDIKDVGGFVGGHLREGKRRADMVSNRSLLTLDIDFGITEIWGRIKEKLDCGVCIYSTHKHSDEKPRLRLIIPLSRQVSPEEYEAVARMVASFIGMEYFDDTTYEPSRLMYWPSTSIDGPFEFQYEDKPWLIPDEILGKYENWRDTSSWPCSSRAKDTRAKTTTKVDDPREKPGITGLFCSTYNIHEAIEKFLPHIYEPIEDGNRYTYKSGSTVGGLVVYEDGGFAYSHHSTDPAQGILCNSYNLVRIHLFGNLDEGILETLPFPKWPSVTAMRDLANKDEGVINTKGTKLFEEIQSSFEEDDVMKKEEVKNADYGYLTKLKRGDNNVVLGTLNNIVIILGHDPNLKGKLAYNDFSHRIMKRENLPWSTLDNEEEGDEFQDSDEACLRHYLEKYYGIQGNVKNICDGLTIIADKNKYHPVREYLDSLNWDGVKRLDTMMIDYMGAEDTEYTRAVTRKTLAAGVGRIYQPGVKFDYMLVLVGKEGHGKSFIIELLGRCWFSDSFTTVIGKEAYEQLQDAWIIETAELTATKRAETEAVKHFISKRKDNYRLAYGKRTVKFPRQCVFFGTTNDNDFLKGHTGNRRFWPVTVAVNHNKKNVFKDMTREVINQLWAEAKEAWNQGEELYLKGEVEKQARRIQSKHTEENATTGPIKDYMEMLIPKNWSEMTIAERRSYIHGSEFGRNRENGTERRTRVCAAEVWTELFQNHLPLIRNYESREINDIIRSFEGWKSYSLGTGRLRFGSIYGVQKAFVRDEKLKEGEEEY